MNLKDRTNLLNDLCARIPYSVKCQCLGRIGTVRSIDTFGNTEVDGFSGSIVSDVSHVKPYLFPLSSMTKEQIKEFNSITQHCSTYTGKSILLTDFCNKYHIDYRGLIEKGLANDATGLNIY